MQPECARRERYISLRVALLPTATCHAPLIGHARKKMLFHARRESQEVPPESRRTFQRELGVQHYWQPEILKDASRVLQLNVPLDFRYSVVYQKVQSSTGSVAMLE